MNEFTYDDWGSSEVLDSRDIEARINELEELEEELREATEDLQAIEDAASSTSDQIVAVRVRRNEAADAYTAENREELDHLRSIREQAKQTTSEWEDGVTLIAASHFLEYARLFAEDIGAISRATWPCMHIDWESAANDLKTDYGDIEEGGKTYLVRSS